MFELASFDIDAFDGLVRLPYWLQSDEQKRQTRLNDAINLDVWLTGGVGLTNGGHGWP